MARVKRQVEKSQYSISLISLNHQSGAISTLCPDHHPLPSHPFLSPLTHVFEQDRCLASSDRDTVMNSS